MSCRNRSAIQKFVVYHLIFFFILTPFLASCGGSGDSSSSTGGGNDTPAGDNEIQLSTSQALPFAFIEIDHPDISANTERVVTFSMPDGTNLNVPAIMTEDGSLKVPIPPFLDIAQEAITSGMVQVSIDGVSSIKTLEIEGLPDMSGTTPGIAAKEMMKLAIESLTDALQDMDDIEVLSGVDTTDLEQSINQQIALLQDAVDEIENNETLTIVSERHGTITLTSEQLHVLDALIYAYISSFDRETNALTAQSRHMSQWSSEPSDNEVLEHVRILGVKFKRAISQIDSGSKAFLASAGLLAAVTVAYIGVGSTLLVAFLGGVGYIVITGANSEGIAALSSRLNPDDAEDYKFGDQLAEKAKSALQDLALSVGGELNNIFDSIDLAKTAKDMYDGFRELTCGDDTDPQPLPRNGLSVRYQQAATDMDTIAFCELIQGCDNRSDCEDGYICYLGFCEPKSDFPPGSSDYFGHWHIIEEDTTSLYWFADTLMMDNGRYVMQVYMWGTELGGQTRGSWSYSLTGYSLLLIADDGSELISGRVHWENENDFWQTGTWAGSTEQKRFAWLKQDDEDDEDDDCPCDGPTCPTRCP